MVIANHTVDKDLSKRGFPFLHRVHSYPNEDKLVELLKLLNAVNLPFTKYSAEELASGKVAYQQLVEHISKSGRLADLLSTEAIKCMSRAKYSPDNIGHFGLATDYYCHFTSPVRRDADLTNQRIVWDCIFRNEGFRAADKWEEKLPAIAEQTYKQERKADEAERSVIRLLSAEYMSHHLEEEFEGIVTGVSSECLTVQLDNLIEGTVRTRALKGSYAYSPDSYSLVSLEGEEDYYIGDHLRLKVKSASTETKKIEFEVVEKLHETSIQNAEEVQQNVKKKSKEEKRKRH